RERRSHSHKEKFGLAARILVLYSRRRARNVPQSGRAKREERGRLEAAFRTMGLEKPRSEKTLGASCRRRTSGRLGKKYSDLQRRRENRHARGLRKNHQRACADFARARRRIGGLVAVEQHDGQGSSVLREE